MVVKTIESFVKGMNSNKNLIKTIRLYDCANNYTLLDSILLEQVRVFTYNEKVQ